jgi:hypothetical protein
MADVRGGTAEAMAAGGDAAFSALIERRGGGVSVSAMSITARTP